MRLIENYPSIDSSDGGSSDGFIVSPFDPNRTQPNHFWVTPEGEVPTCHPIAELSGSLPGEVSGEATCTPAIPCSPGQSK